jgi:methionine-gamma-lyase
MHEKEGETHIFDRRLSPESLMMGYGYRPEWSEGSIKCPIFQTSTFVFKSAEDGKAFFEQALGKRKTDPGEYKGLIYSRINNPDLEILEDRLTLWDQAESGVVFESGMAAITTTLFEYLSPGDLLLHSDPLYGGTEYLLAHVLPRFGIKVAGFRAPSSREEIERVLRESGSADRLAMIFVETPANPTNGLVDIEFCAELARRHSTDDRRVLLAVDNTFLGPLFQHPLEHGADLVLYSATKFIGGHSDVIAGVCLGRSAEMDRVRNLRSFTGSMAGPWTGWLLLRSLETLKLRMTAMMENARVVADFLSGHPKVEKVYYLGNLTEEDGDQYRIYRKQCLAPGSMVSFDVRGGEKEAFRFLNFLKLIRLAVSLGGTESLAQHPATMTHADVEPEDQLRMGITEKMVRLSIGVENHEDLIADLDQALETI